MPSRREFLKTTVFAGAGLMLYGAGGAEIAWAFSQSPMLRKFAQPLPGVSLPPYTSSGMPVAVPTPDPFYANTDFYQLTIGQYAQQLHPDLPKATRLFGFAPLDGVSAGNPVFRHLGGIIVAQRGRPVRIRFTNQLPGTHIIPVDLSIMGASQGPNRTAVHLHGGKVPWISDGGPFAWFTPSGATGVSFLNNQVLNPSAAPNKPVAGQADYYYPNDQSARLVWYHDHAFGTTRINAYAGIASGYIIRDLFEAGLRNQGLPDFIENGGREIPLIIQDKIFVSPSIALTDPTWPGGASTAGDLWYAHVYERHRWGLRGNAVGGNLIPPDPSVVAEFFGDTMLANGVVYPEAAVEPRRYRLRILNACNARFLNLQLYVDDGSPDGITLDPDSLAPLNAKGPDFLQIGAEAGFLPKPVWIESNVPFDSETLEGSLILGPAERADILIDFEGYEGKELILYNDAPAPFPEGDPRNDYFPGAPKNPTVTTPGLGPNTRQILRFSVGTTVTPPADPPLAIDTTTDLTPGNDPLLVPAGVTVPPPGVTVRQLTLNETFDVYGRLIQLLGTNVAPVKGTFGRAYLDTATETPQAGSIEVWQIANTTGDTHPIHFHLVNVQVISRQPFKVNRYNGAPIFTGSARPPDPNEAGWKETVRMNPGEVTTVIMKFDLPAVPFAVPTSPRTGGNEYVWHCHILEHEEHDMMRPLIVI